MVAVDVSANRPGTAEFYAENGFSIPNVFDTERVAIDRYGVAATPTTYLVDADGTILWRRYGYLPGEEVRLQHRVEELLRR